MWTGNSFSASFYYILLPFLMTFHSSNHQVGQKSEGKIMKIFYLAWSFEPKNWLWCWSDSDQIFIRFEQNLRPKDQAQCVVLFCVSYILNNEYHIPHISIWNYSFVYTFSRPIWESSHVSADKSSHKLFYPNVRVGTCQN